jgi:hypothetical protein
LAAELGENASGGGNKVCDFATSSNAKAFTDQLCPAFVRLALSLLEEWGRSRLLNIASNSARTGQKA